MRNGIRGSQRIPEGYKLCEAVGGWREGGTVLSQDPCLCDANVPHQPSTQRPICVQRVMEGVLLITTLLVRPGV